MSQMSMAERPTKKCLIRFLNQVPNPNSAYAYTNHINTINLPAEFLNCKYFLVTFMSQRLTTRRSTQKV